MKMFLMVFLSIFIFVGCASMGNNFDFKGPSEIVIGKTKDTELIRKWGRPFRVGYEDGKLQWTYGYYKYKLFGDSITKDLIVTFDNKGIVQSYTYNTSIEEDKDRMLYR